ncbi:hypothetical protein AVEN_97366-1 [Araneus ventricosus]|uniref:Uncharacterized protein n=1 Tax=Araneus ventricosus TaxID=182803 RepID=A0A4Y2JDK9_ARAVE|nr:hypothetical protein AVEN_97366-1 [Araneus ventricosus]
MNDGRIMLGGSFFFSATLHPVNRDGAINQSPTGRIKPCRAFRHCCFRGPPFSSPISLWFQHDMNDGRIMLGGSFFFSATLQPVNRDGAINQSPPGRIKLCRGL